MRWRRWLWLLVLVPVLFAGLSMASCSVPELGLRDGRLLPVSDRPNCVSSLATDESHRVEPFELRGDPTQARDQLERIVAAMPRSVLLSKEESYLRFQFASLIFRFKDDLEFHLVPGEGVIHVRAAARVGYSDFGVNRRRVETVRQHYDAWLSDREK